jgi:hypothetical protein
MRPGLGDQLGRLCRYSHSQHRAAVLIFRTGPVVPVDWGNLIAGCSGHFDRTSLATALAFSVLAATNPVISNADNAIDGFISASSVGYPLDDASVITPRLRAYQPATIPLEPMSAPAQCVTNGAANNPLHRSIPVLR